MGVTFTHTHFSAPSKMTSSTEIDVMPKRLKIAKFRLQILIDNSKSYLKRTYFIKIEEKMTKLWCSKVGSNLNSKTGLHKLELIPLECLIKGFVISTIIIIIIIIT